MLFFDKILHELSLFPDVIVLSNCDWVDGRHHIVNNLHDIFYEDKTENEALPELDKGYI